MQTTLLTNLQYPSAYPPAQLPASALRELIIYACPLGPLADQLEAYFAQSKAECGPNKAHDYMPHVTLTGFFHDVAASIPVYASALYAALSKARFEPPASAITVTGLVLREGFHYLDICAPWVQALVADFACHVRSATRTDALRLKDGLHLSLAYGFAPERGERLAQLAQELVDPFATARWELRLYERSEANQWSLHGCWRLD
jgi:ubiquitin-associated SH3 domain-containing protein